MYRTKDHRVDEDSLIDMADGLVEVYWNRKRRMWSVRNYKTGRVVEYKHVIRLSAPVFVVHQSGRKKFLETGKRTVHAWVRGYEASADPSMLKGPPLEVRYNPKVDEHFVFVDDPECGIISAVYAVLWSDPSTIVKEKPRVYVWQ